VIVGDIGDAGLARRTIREYGITAVMHFAAYAYVGESVAGPLKCYENNVSVTVRLLRAMIDADHELRGSVRVDRALRVRFRYRSRRRKPVRRTGR
jgi:dTDP-D-glucose 4,6-dehydratase